MWVLVLLVITSIVILFVNSVCLQMTRKKRGLKRPSSIAILNLLCCHIAQGAVVIPSYILKRAEFEDKEAASLACDSFRFSYMVTNYSLCLSILFITMDRAFAIKKPFLYRSKMTSRRTVYAYAGCWIYTVILCVIPFIPLAGNSFKCRYNPQREWTLFMLTCNTMLPFCIIVCCYIAIFQTVQRSRVFRDVSLKDNNKSSPPGSKDSELRIAKISFVIVSAYILCWGPSFVYYFLLAACPSCFRASYLASEAEPVVTFVMKYLTFLNGIINPVVYCLANKSSGRGANLRRKRNAVRKRAYASELNLQAAHISKDRAFTVSQVTLEESI